MNENILELIKVAVLIMISNAFFMYGYFTLDRSPMIIVYWFVPFAIISGLTYTPTRSGRWAVAAVMGSWLACFLITISIP